MIHYSANFVNNDNPGNAFGCEAFIRFTRLRR